MSNTLNIGEAVPNFEAPATSDLHFKLSDYKGKSNLVLYFYPKDSTPGCTIEGNDFGALHETFKGLDTEIFGISKDTMKRHDNFRAKQGFPFELISDSETEVCELFGTWQLKKTFGKEYMGIVRSTFLIDKDGVLRQQWNSVKVKGHADEVLDAVKSL
ncbi:MAG: peroxiredoxin [Cocleimonas sp.]